MKKKHKKKKRQIIPGPRVREEYRWLNQQNMAGGPSNPMALPIDPNISSCPELTLAQKWIRENCKFASS